MKRIVVKNEPLVKKSVIIKYKEEFEKFLRMSQNEGYTIKKLWIPDIWYGRKNPKTCEKHIHYARLGYVDLNYEYAPGLKFPFDPDCNDEIEKIDCHCWMGYDLNASI
ncbi:MAG: hypothetical protein NTZ85_06720 [Bacteroidia bacterium]|jgi:hypothetical protein|nr:hypothetical protein [Bacteroidia bacterium]